LTLRATPPPLRRLLARPAALYRYGENEQDAGPRRSSAEKKKKIAGTRQGAQEQGRTDSQVARGQSPPSPISESMHAISMLEPACRVRVAAACT
jgi:hypothetical protein